MVRGSSLSEAGDDAERRLGDGQVGQTTRSCSDAHEDLAWTDHDHHFAPGKEEMAAVYRCSNLSSDKLTVTVTDRAGSLVYRREVNGREGRNDFKWDGRGNEDAWRDRLITPLESPYKVRIARDASLSREFELYVLYHSIQIGIGTWIDGPEPDRATEPVKWVQYKLNMLGYFAGPVDGDVGDQTKRAMKRYVRMMPTLHPDDVVQPNFHETPELQDALAANEHERDVLPGGLPAEGAAGKLFVDHNVFAEESMGRVTPMSEVEPDQLDRPELPLEVEIFLVGREDSNGTGQGVVASEAVGDVAIEWRVYDAPEDTDRLACTNPKDCPTRRRDYIELVLRETRALDGSDNCPDTFGGARKITGDANSNYFRVGDQLPPFTSEVKDDAVYSTAWAGAGPKQGKAGVLFRASYIGGDDYRIEARLSFAGRDNEAELIEAHNRELDADWATRGRVSTGKLVVWRRVQVAAVVNWPGTGHDIDWQRVADEYAYAYIELLRPKRTMTSEEFLAEIFANAPEDDRRKFVRNVTSRLTKTEEPAELNGDGLFQVPIPQQGEKEKATEYIKRVDDHLHKTLCAGRYPMLFEYSKCIATFFRRQGLVGSIIIIGKWVPTIDVSYPPGKAPRSGTGYDPEITSIGLSHGVAVIVESQFARYDHRFVVAHEIGHTRFLSHHEVGRGEGRLDYHPNKSPSANPKQHDTADHNCTMSYPEKIPSRNKNKKAPLEWSRTSATHSAFCGKCLLKLRGWNVDDLPESSNR